MMSLSGIIFEQKSKLFSEWRHPWDIDFFFLEQIVDWLLKRFTQYLLVSMVKVKVKTKFINKRVGRTIGYIDMSLLNEKENVSDFSIHWIDPWAHACVCLLCVPVCPCVWCPCVCVWQLRQFYFIAYRCDKRLVEFMPSR